MRALDASSASLLSLPYESIEDEFEDIKMTPSTTYRGSDEPVSEDIPLILMFTAASGAALFERTCTPAAFPCSNWSIDELCAASSSLTATEVTLPVRSERRIAPYPTTTSSSRNLESSSSTKLTFAFPDTGFSTVLKLIIEAVSLAFAASGTVIL